MAVSRLSSLAAAAPAPVYAAIGEGAAAAVEDLLLDARLDRAASPRHAALLLVCGRFRDDDIADLCRLHDQLPHPRATLRWRAEALPGFTPDGVDLAPDADVAAALHAVYRALVAGARASEPALLPDEPPNPWRGRGDHGQGGEGMMGGVPYGRPMAMTDDDLRDGLALDAYAAPFGPFLSAFPPGLRLDLTLQGDVIQKLAVARPPYNQPPEAAHPLRLAARMLLPLGLPGLAERMLRRAAGLAPGAPVAVADLARALRWRGALAALPPGLGRIPGGGDVRARLDGLLAAAGRGEAAPAPGAPMALSELLVGREWAEAMLVLASLEPGWLRRACRADMPHAPSEDAA